MAEERGVGMNCKKCKAHCAWVGKERDVNYKCLVGYVPITNGDRIRSMTDEEIEAWFWWMHKEMMWYTDSHDFLRKWLKKEVADEHTD